MVSFENSVSESGSSSIAGRRPSRIARAEETPACLPARPSCLAQSSRRRPEPLIPKFITHREDRSRRPSQFLHNPKPFPSFRPEHPVTNEWGLHATAIRMPETEILSATIRNELFLGCGRQPALKSSGDERESRINVRRVHHEVAKTPRPHGDSHTSRVDHLLDGVI